MFYLFNNFWGFAVEKKSQNCNLNKFLEIIRIRIRKNIGGKKY